MNYKKALFLLYALISAKAIFGMEQKSLGSQTKSPSTLVSKEKAKPNRTREILKGLAGLAGFAIFAQAIVHADHHYLRTINKENTQTTPQDVLKDLPLAFVIALCYPLRAALGLSFEKGEDAFKVLSMNTAISSILSYTLGKYGLTKLYNVYKSRKNDSIKNI